MPRKTPDKKSRAEIQQEYTERKKEQRMIRVSPWIPEPLYDEFWEMFDDWKKTWPSDT